MLIEMEMGSKIAMMAVLEMPGSLIRGFVVVAPPSRIEMEMIPQTV